MAEPMSATLAELSSSRMGSCPAFAVPCSLFVFPIINPIVLHKAKRGYIIPGATGPNRFTKAVASNGLNPDEIQTATLYPIPPPVSLTSGGKASPTQAGIGPAISEVISPMVACAKNAGTDLPIDITQSKKGAMTAVKTVPTNIIVTRSYLSLR